MDPVIAVFEMEDRVKLLRHIDHPANFLEVLNAIRTYCNDLETWVNAGGYLPGDPKPKKHKVRCIFCQDPFESLDINANWCGCPMEGTE